MARDYIYRCDECNTIFSNPLEPKKNIEHLNIKNGEVLFDYFSTKEKKWLQQKVNLDCQEYHFCNGKCLGKYLDKKISEVTVKIKEE